MKKSIILFILLFSINLLAQDIPNLAQKNGKYALVDNSGKIISNYYSAIYDFDFGIALVRENTQFGAINKEGKIVIPVKKNAKDIKEEYTIYLKKFLQENPNNQEVKKYLAEIEAEKLRQEELKIKQKKQKALAELKENASNFYKNEEDLENLDWKIINTQKCYTKKYKKYKQLVLILFMAKDNTLTIMGIISLIFFMISLAFFMSGVPLSVRGTLERTYFISLFLYFINAWGISNPPNSFFTPYFPRKS